jgi:hypothetical protein
MSGGRTIKKLATESYISLTTFRECHERRSSESSDLEATRQSRSYVPQDNIPAIPGSAFGNYLENAAAEIGEEAGIGALCGGFTALANGGDFGQGAASGAEFGAAFAGGNIALLGAKLQPSATEEQLRAAYTPQSSRDYSGVSPAFPDRALVSFRAVGYVAKTVPAALPKEWEQYQCCINAQLENVCLQKVAPTE